MISFRDVHGGLQVHKRHAREAARFPLRTNHWLEHKERRAMCALWRLVLTRLKKAAAFLNRSTFVSVSFRCRYDLISDGGLAQSCEKPMGWDDGLAFHSVGQSSGP